MTHIANCMRPEVLKANVYIMSETPLSSSPVSDLPPAALMPHQTLQRSRSLKDKQTVKDSTRAFGFRPSKLALQQQPTSKYQLWPTTSNRSPLGSNRLATSSDRSIALSMGRSPTSLSDTAVSPDAVPFWHRGGSLSRRRKISVPELGGTMATVQETAVDSRKSGPAIHMCPADTS